MNASIVVKLKEVNRLRANSWVMVFTVDDAGNRVLRFSAPLSQIATHDITFNELDSEGQMVEKTEKGLDVKLLAINQAKYFPHLDKAPSLRFRKEERFLSSWQARSSNIEVLIKEQLTFEELEARLGE